MIAGAIYGTRLAYLNSGSGSLLEGAAVGGYMAFSLYWGVPIVWRWWNDKTEYQRTYTASFRHFVVWFLFGLFIVPVGGYFYGFFGGALYQLLKALWLTRR